MRNVVMKITYLLMLGSVILCFGKDTGNESFIFKGTARNKRTKKTKQNCKNKKKKILGVTIDSKLTFKSHIKDLSKKASQKSIKTLKSTK